jgi:hypothetical protein
MLIHCWPLGTLHGVGNLHWKAIARTQIEPPTALMHSPANAAMRCERVEVKRMYSKQLEALETYVAAR